MNLAVGYDLKPILLQTSLISDARKSFKKACLASFNLSKNIFAFTCVFEYFSEPITIFLSCSPNGLDCIDACAACELKYDISDHLYLHSGNISTIIFRAIEIFDICLDDDWDEKIPDDIENSCADLGGNYKTIGIEVTSRVFWEKAGKKHYTDVKEKLYNWKRW